MYFSKHNEKIVYINHYSGLLEIKGEGVLCLEDTDVTTTLTESLAGEYDTLSITEGITEVGEGFLDAFPNICCLILSRTVSSVAVTPETVKRMRKRKVLICGEYDTFTEKFANENKLDFLHSDIPLAEYDIEVAHEHDIDTIRFHRNWRENRYCQMKLSSVFWRFQTNGTYQSDTQSLRSKQVNRIGTIIWNLQWKKNLRHVSNYVKRVTRKCVHSSGKSFIMAGMYHRILTVPCDI